MSKTHRVPIRKRPNRPPSNPFLFVHVHIGCWYLLREYKYQQTCSTVDIWTGMDQWHDRPRWMNKFWDKSKIEMKYRRLFTLSTQARAGSENIQKSKTFYCVCTRIFLLTWRDTVNGACVCHACAFQREREHRRNCIGSFIGTRAAPARIGAPGPFKTRE